MFLAVHPHARGEDVAFVGQDGQEDGSPPRTWGRRADLSGPGLLPRFTPTHVGKTSAWRRAAMVSWFTPTHVGKTAWIGKGIGEKTVHPHARGEDCGTPLPT